MAVAMIDNVGDVTRPTKKMAWLWGGTNSIIWEKRQCLSLHPQKVGSIVDSNIFIWSHSIISSGIMQPKWSLGGWSTMIARHTVAEDPTEAKLVWSWSPDRSRGWPKGNDFCIYIAIWFDEYRITGSSFKRLLDHLSWPLGYFLLKVFCNCVDGWNWTGCNS